MAKSSKATKRRRSAARPRPVAAPTEPSRRRPANPVLLMLVGLIWAVCGIYVLFSVTATWKVIPAILFLGIGMFFIRIAAVTYTRLGEHGPPKP